MAVELLVPLTAVSQLAAAFLCGCCIFQERSTVMQQVGFVTWPKHGEIDFGWEMGFEFQDIFSEILFGGMMDWLLQLPSTQLPCHFRSCLLQQLHCWVAPVFNRTTFIWLLHTILLHASGRCGWNRILNGFVGIPTLQGRSYRNSTANSATYGLMMFHMCQPWVFCSMALNFEWQRYGHIIVSESFLNSADRTCFQKLDSHINAFDYILPFHILSLFWTRGTIKNRPRQAQTMNCTHQVRSLDPCHLPLQHCSMLLWYQSCHGFRCTISLFRWYAATWFGILWSFGETQFVNIANWWFRNRTMIGRHFLPFALNANYSILQKACTTLIFFSSWTLLRDLNTLEVIKMI